jgi:peptidyl-prolyl cis-trans isomerase SurA
MRRILLIGFVCLMADMAHAQGYKIAAKVNNKIITSSEVATRADLIALSSGLSGTPELKKQFSSQALKDLVNEQLQLQEAAKYGVTEDTARVDDILSQISARMKDVDAAKKAIFLENLRGQFNAQSTWMTIIRQLFGSSVVVSDDEIEQQYVEMKHQKSQKQFLVSEIVMPFEPGKDMEVLTRSQEIVTQLRQGVPFSIVAKQISKGSTAQAGGDLGWIILGQNDPILDKTVSSMKQGDISDPIRVTNGYVIYQLKDIKAPGSMSLDETFYTFNQVAVPENWAPESLQTHVSALMEAKTCEEFQAHAKSSIEIQFRDNKEVKATLLPPALQDLLRNLKDGEKTKPMKAPEGILLFMMCKKTFKEEPLPTKEQVRDYMEQKRFNLFSQRHLKELRKTALIEMTDE